MDENPDSKPAGIKGMILLKPSVYLCMNREGSGYIGDITGNAIFDPEVFEEGFKIARKRGYIPSNLDYRLTKLGKAMMNLTQ